MKIQSKFFVLFLFLVSFLSTRSWAQTYSVQQAGELEASQEAHQLGEDTRRNEPLMSEAQKGENRSTDAMRWKTIAVSQQSEWLPAFNKQPLDSQKLSPKISIYKQVNKPVKMMPKPVNHRL